MEDERVAKAVAEVEKKYYEGLLRRMDERPQKMLVIPTGSVTLDRALRVGGMPRGRLAEVIGPESTGKSTLLQHLIAEAQVQNENCLLVDMEHSLDPVYAAACGVDLDKLWICQPDYGEMALNVVEECVDSGAFGLICLDSIASLVPQAEYEGDIGDQLVGAQARMMSQALRKLGPKIAKSNTAVVMTNQIREKVGVIYGSPETTPGGRAMKFYSSVRIDLRKREVLKRGNAEVGIMVEAKVIKNKCGAPFGRAMLEIYWGTGISKAAGLLDAAIDAGIVKKAGAWLSFEGARWQGREAARNEVDASPELVAALERALSGVTP